MRVKLDSLGGGTGGVARVYEGIYRYLPAYGVEFVSDTSQAEVYHAHIALYETLRPDLPLVVSSHGMLWDEHKWEYTGRKVNRMCIAAYRQADVLTTPSEFVAHALARNMLIRPQVVRHGINSEEWLPGISQGYILWNKARIDAANNPVDMNTLAKRVPAIQFLSTFGEAAANVTITGQIPSDQMKERVRSAAVYLDTAKESGGPCFGVLEAMSCGVPVLAWDEGGTPEAVQHQVTGYLAKPGDFEDLVQGLFFCLQHRDYLGANARQLVKEHYQWEQVIGGYYEAYQLAIKKQALSPAVSVIVPCYNLGRFLPACVESVQQQFFNDWEMVIVDDASTDNSGEIADQLAAGDKRIKVIHQPANYHVSAARNTGIKASTGKYILPLDADDRLPEQALGRLTAALDTDRSLDIVAGKLMLFSEADLANGWMGEWPNNADYELQIQGYNRLPYSSLYRRKVWERVGGYRTRIRDGVEDADFWTRALSFGCKAKILDEPTLHYTLRADGLGKQNKRGIEAWLPWFGWSVNPNLTPFAAVGKENYPVQAFDKPVVSVIIPVGPGHTAYVQGCLDSLLAQTDNRWEAVVINDTGGPLDLAGMPFVRLLNNETNLGVARSRNRGIRAARADLIIFLDVDDIAQPRMVELFIKAYKYTGGWLYADWLSGDGPHTAPDWDINRFRVKMLAPVTGLYAKEHLLEVGGFNEDSPGWEDWELQYKLVAAGVCGTRVAYPAIYYNMGAGKRREENFSRAEALVQYIQKTYGDKPMACGRCGGQSTLVVKNNPEAATMPLTDKRVIMNYTGPMRGFFTRRSKTVPGTFYRISNAEPFEVAAGDVADFLRNAEEYRVADNQPLELPTGVTNAVLTAPILPEDQGVEMLKVRPETLGIVVKYYKTINELRAASDADLLGKKGLGPTRIKEIREALA